MSDVRQARGLPVYTVGSCSVQGLRNLLSHVRLASRSQLPTFNIVADCILVCIVVWMSSCGRNLSCQSVALVVAARTDVLLGSVNGV